MRKVYLASWYASRPQMREIAKDFQDSGITITSSWLDEKYSPLMRTSDGTDEMLLERATEDMKDMDAADILVMNTPNEETYNSVPIDILSRGGHHFEAGYFYGLILNQERDIFDAQCEGYLNYNPVRRKLIIVGKKENVFHFLPKVIFCNTWEEAKLEVLK